MKLLAIEMSRLTSLFNITRPQGQLYLPNAALALIDRYAFAKGPTTFDELSADRVDFQHGFFQDSAIEKLEVYQDGIVVSSQSESDLLDGFVSDLLQWSEKEFGSTIFPNRQAGRLYDSQLIIEASDAMLAPLEALNGIAGQIGAMLKESSGLDIPFQSVGYTLAHDRTKNPLIQPNIFRLERRFAAEFSLNQFISVAPLRTSQHIELLEAIEAEFND